MSLSALELACAMSNSTVLVSASVTLDSIFGSMLIGTLFSMCLWGIACVQTYDYFMESSNADGLLQKLVVILLWIIDTFNSVMHIHAAYFNLVTNYGNPRSLTASIWSVNCNTLVPGISNFIIRTMFVRRIYQFSGKNIIMTVWIMFISTFDLVVSIVVTVYIVRSHEAGGVPIVPKLLYLSYALDMTADLSVAVALCWLLQSAKTGFRRSDTIVNVLMAYVVNTGLLVTLNALVTLILYAAMPGNYVYSAFYILLGKLYVNAYLASLNARKRLRGIDSESPMPLSRLDIPQTSSSKTTDDKTNTFHNLAISFQKTVERKVDGDDEIKSPLNHQAM